MINVKKLKFLKLFTDLELRIIYLFLPGLKDNEICIEILVELNIYYT